MAIILYDYAQHGYNSTVLHTIMQTSGCHQLPHLFNIRSPMLNLFLVMKSRHWRLCCVIGAGLSKPHIDKFAVEFVYIYKLCLPYTLLLCKSRACNDCNVSLRLIPQCHVFRQWACNSAYLCASQRFGRIVLVAHYGHTAMSSDFVILWVALLWWGQK